MKNSKFAATVVACSLVTAIPASAGGLVCAIKGNSASKGWISDIIGVFFKEGE